MKIRIFAVLLSVALASPVLAAKNEGTVNGKSSAEQKAAHQSAMQARDDDDDKDEYRARDEDEVKKQKQKQSEKASSSQKYGEKQQAKGKEKQAEKKLNQEQKELDKGSEQGMASRENRKKWWNFWSE